MKATVAYDVIPEKKDILVLDDPAFHEGHVCLVTGAGSGIGQAVAVAAAANGITTLGVGRRADAGQETVDIAQRLGGTVQFLSADLTCDRDASRVVESATKLGEVRYLVNVAGVQHISPIEDFPLDQYDSMQRLMLRAPFHLTKLIIPHMRSYDGGWGVIANTASIHAHIATQNKSAYTMLKFGIRGLTQAIAAEGEGRIRAFSVTTPYVATPMATNQISDQAKTRDISEDRVVSDVMLGRSRVKRLMQPIEAANLFIFGLSCFARFLVGADLKCDGGMVLTY